jgi:outer membrane protein
MGGAALSLPQLARAQVSWVAPLDSLGSSANTAAAMMDFNQADALIYSDASAILTAPGADPLLTAQAGFETIPTADGGLPLAISTATNAAGAMLSEMGVATALGDASDLPDIHAPALEANEPIYASTPLDQGQAIPAQQGQVVQYRFDETGASSYGQQASSQVLESISVAPPQPVAQPSAQQQVSSSPRMDRVAAVSGVSASPSFSDAIPKKRDSGLAPTDFGFVLGAGLAVRPDYQGSNDYEIAPNILFDISFKDTVFLSSKHGLGVVPFKTENVYSDLHLKYWGARGDSGDLDGMVPVDPSMAVGATIGLRSQWVDLDLTGDWGVLGGNTGLDLELSAAHWFDINESFSLRPKAWVAMSDNNYNDTLFGISTAEATAVNAALTAAGRTETVSVYDPNGGFREFGTSLDLEYSFTPNFSIVSSADMSVLLGDARQSPLVQKLGSPFQWGLGLVGVYRF